MSPSRIGEGLMNGSRPTPLKMNKESRVIHKSVEQTLPKNTSTKKPPVIIYTQTPKVIHADARDFMTLVQKLTGLDRTQEENKVKLEPQSNLIKNKGKGNEVNDVKKFGTHEEKYEFPNVSPPMFGVPSYMADLPRFTTNSSELFCSSNPFQSSISPNSNSFIMDCMKAFPEY